MHLNLVVSRRSRPISCTVSFDIRHKTILSIELVDELLTAIFTNEGKQMIFQYYE